MSDGGANHARPGPSIAVVSATLDAARVLPRLVASLQGQTDPDFRWIVVDGGSSDETADIVRASGLPYLLMTGRDFGIYDALNRGVAAVDEAYYLVVGADDQLAPDSIQQYRAAAEHHGRPDFVAASIRQRGRVVPAQRGPGWLYGMPGVASSHSVGLLIARGCHERFGLYSRRFPIAADQLFVKQAIAGGATLARGQFIAGEFAEEGTSAHDSLGLLTELFRVQVLTERYALPQYLLFGARLLKYLLSSLASGRGGR